MHMDRSFRQARADLRRRTAVLNRTRLAHTEPDPCPLCGPDAPNRPNQGSEVTFDYILPWAPTWSEEGRSFSRSFDEEGWEKECFGLLLNAPLVLR